MSYIYSFLEEQAKERVIAQGYCDLVCAVIGRAVDDYKECNEFAMSAWEFLTQFSKLKDLPKPKCKKVSNFQAYDNKFLFEII